MARVPYFDIGLAEGRAADTYAKLPRLNIFAMMGHAGCLIDGVTRLGNQVLSHTELEPWLREIVILRVGVLTGSAYEVHQHRLIALAYGIEADRVEQVISGSLDSLDERERLICDLVPPLLSTVRLDDALFVRAVETFGIRCVQEIVLLVGYYFMMSRFLVTFDVDIEQGEATLPMRLPGMVDVEPS